MGLYRQSKPRMYGIRCVFPVIVGLGLYAILTVRRNPGWESVYSNSAPISAEGSSTDPYSTSHAYVRENEVTQVQDPNTAAVRDVVDPASPEEVVSDPQVEIEVDGKDSSTVTAALKPEDSAESQDNTREPTNASDMRESESAGVRSGDGIQINETDKWENKAKTTTNDPDQNASDSKMMNVGAAAARGSNAGMDVVMPETSVERFGTPGAVSSRIPADYSFRCNGTGGQRWIRNNAKALESMVKLKDYSYTVTTPKSNTHTADGHTIQVISDQDKAQVVITQRSCAKVVRNTFDVYVTGATVYHHSLFEVPQHKRDSSGANTCEWTVTLPRLNPGQHRVGVVLEYLADRALMEPHAEAFPIKNYISVCSDPSLAAVGQVYVWRGLFSIRDISDGYKTIKIPHCALGLHIDAPHDVLVESSSTQANKNRQSLTACARGDNRGKWVHYTSAHPDLVETKYDLEPQDDYIWTPFKCMYERQTIPALFAWAESYPQVNQTSGLKIAFVGDSVMEQIRYHVTIELSKGEPHNPFFDDKSGHLWHKPDTPFSILYRELWGVYTRKYGQTCAPACPRGHIGIPNLVVRLLREYFAEQQPNMVVIGSVLHDLMQSTLEDYRNVDTILSFLNSWASENPSRRVIWLSGTATHNGLRFKMFRTTTRVQRANEMVQEYIRKYKYDRIEYMDIYHMTLSRPDRSYDGIHYTLRSSKLKQKSRHTARATEPGFCDGDWFDQQMYRQIDYPDSLVRIQARMVLDTLMRTT